MAESEMKNAPPLYGWAIATGAGAVAAAISFLQVGIEGNGSVFIGIVVAVVVGIVFTIADTAGPKSGPVTPGTAGADNAAPTSAASTAAPEIAPAKEPAPAPSAPASAGATAAAPAAASPAPAEPAPAETVAAEPAPAPAAEPEGVKPAMLDAAIGEADDLKQISGVGPKLEGTLNELGVYHFWQIARWTPVEIAWVDGYLNFKGRIDRDEWIAQAARLAETSPSKPPA